jgi:hypothetical protein
MQSRNFGFDKQRRNKMKTRNFLMISIFALVLLCQSSVYGQTPTPTPVNKATAPPTVKTQAPQDKGRKTTPPSMADKLGIKDLPDLQITEMKVDKPDCAVYIRVVNKGFKDAGAFHVWANFVGISLYESRIVVGLARNKDISLKFTAWSLPNWLSHTDKCFMDKTVRVQAVADARYSYSHNLVGLDGLFNVGVEGLLKPGSPAPAGMKVIEPQVEELNENNNELVVNIKDMKPYP